MNATKPLSARQIHLATLVALGKSNAEIAELTGFPERAIAAHKASPLFKALVTQTVVQFRERLLSTAADTIAANADSAAMRVADLVHSGDERISLNASNSILDRTPSTTRVSRTQPNAGRNGLHLTDEQVERLSAVLVESRGGPSSRAIPALASRLPSVQTLDDAIADLGE